MDVATFRSDLPEFGVSPNTGTPYSDARITFWLGVGTTLLNGPRWGSLLDHGLELFVAHHLTLDARNQRAAATGGEIGQVDGPLTAAAVDKVSASYASERVTLELGAHWNQSTYGTQFLYLARMVGAGGIQL